MFSVDFALEANKKTAISKALLALGNQALGYDIIVLDSETGFYRPNDGVDIVVFVPQGASKAQLDFFHTIGPFVHRRGVYDEDGLELEAPVVSPNWFVNVRLSKDAWIADDNETGSPSQTAFNKSKIRAWIKSTGAELVRSSENSDHPGSVNYWHKDLDAGSPSDWVRLYYNISQWKNSWFGGMSE